MIRVAIVGGTGYTGVELLRLLASHSEAEVVAVTSRGESGIEMTSWGMRLLQAHEIQEQLQGTGRPRRQSTKEAQSGVHVHAGTILRYQEPAAKGLAPRNFLRPPHTGVAGEELVKTRLIMPASRAWST